MNFGPLTTKLCLLILTYPKSTVCSFSDNFRLWARISLVRIKISTSGKQCFQLLSKMQKKLVELGLLTTKLCLLISTYPTSTVRAFSDNS